MIKLNRDRTPASISPFFIGAKRANKLAGLYKKRLDLGKLESKDFDSDYWKKSKERIQIESLDKCAYCESPVPQVAHGDVEHFRPKVPYWWLAYCYDNYLFSCQICNQVYKSDHFPLSNATNILKEPIINNTFSKSQVIALFDEISPEPTSPDAVIKKYFAYLKPEKGLLINPYYDDDPERYFVWKADDDLQEVEMLANTAKSGAKKIFTTVETFYGLNRTKLKQLRYSYFKHFRIYKAAIRNNLDPQLVADSKTMVKEMTEAKHPFAAMLRYFDKKL